MKKILLLVMAFLISGAAFALDTKNSTGNGFITVNASATDKVVPNIASVVFYVETQNKNQTIAVDENKKIALKVIETIKKNINEKTDTVKTLNYSVSPSYIYSGSKKTFDKYVALNTIQVETRNPKNISYLIDETIKAGATRVSGLNYTLDYEKFDYSELINNAVKSAKNRADATASALGVKIVGIKNVTTSCSADQAARYLYMNAKSSGADSSSSSYTEEGLVKVEANVNIEFWIK